MDIHELKRFIPEIEAKQEIKGIEQFVEMYEKSKRPIVLAGNGVRLSGSVDKLREFVSKNNIPCAVSYLAADYFEQENPNYVGRLGIKGDRAGNFAIQNSDLIICLGSRLSVCLTGFEYELFARESKLIVVDIDKDEHKKNTVNIDQLIHADVGAFLENIENKISPNVWGDWQNKCMHWKNKWPVYQNGYDTNTVNMYEFTRALSELANEDQIVVSDAGSSYYVTSQSFTLNNKNRLRPELCG